MMKLYFTFGSDEVYPYKEDQYVVAYGTGHNDCLNAFSKKHPGRNGVLCSCANYYTEKEWIAHLRKPTSAAHANSKPVEVIVSDKAYGKKPEGYDDIWFYVPAKNQLIYMQEGTGDNLLQEDRDNGYVDYIDIAAYELENGIPEETDGGMMMTEYMIRDCYKCLADAIPDVLDYLFDTDELDAQILQQVK